jgi:hypothetical protein
MQGKRKSNVDSPTFPARPSLCVIQRGFRCWRYMARHLEGRTMVREIILAARDFAVLALLDPSEGIAMIAEHWGLLVTMAALGAWVLCEWQHGR